MKQKTAIIGLSMISLAALAPSCSEEAGGFGSGEGRIMPTVNIDTEAVTSRAMSRAEVTDVTKDDLSLRIAKKDGSFQKHGTSWQTSTPSRLSRSASTP